MERGYEPNLKELKYTVLVRPEAEHDLKEAFIWYEEKRAGLGFDFLLNIQASFEYLERAPLTFPEVYKNVRRSFIKRFPYKIIYRVNQSSVTVLGVIYGGRNPQYFNQRSISP